MRCFPMLGVLALLTLLAVPGPPAPSQAQEITGSTDFRGRASYSAEDIAQALFPQETSAPRTRGIGPPPTRPSMPTQRPAVTLNVLFGSNSDVIPPASYAEIDKLGTLLTLQRHLSISHFISTGYSVFMSSILTVFIAITP
jgi:hypothetical protein